MNHARKLKLITDYPKLEWMAGHEEIDAQIENIERCERILGMIKKAERRYQNRIELGLYKQADQSKKASLRLRQYFNNLIIDELGI